MNFFLVFSRNDKRSIYEKIFFYKKGKADKLSKKETEILELICTSFENKTIAYKLNVSVKTVESHKQNIKEKLGLQSIKELYN